MEASALQAPARLTRGRVSLSSQLLRLRSDEQLVAMFRDGSEEAFRAIHDRYRQRLFAYTRQMLPTCRQDAEDALQDVFVRAYSGLRANNRELALRAWLYRVAHNRCIDELRRPPILLGEVEDRQAGLICDPVASAEQRELLTQLVTDLRRLPEQQRSALLMRELSGMSYSELADALEITVPAVKSLLVRARVNLTRALEARETACSEIREELIDCHDRGVRASSTSRRHLHDCASCREFRVELRGLSRQFSALIPGVGSIGLVAKLLGLGGGSSASGGSAAAGGAAGGGAVSTGAAAVAGGTTVAVAGGTATVAGGAFGGGTALTAGGFLSGTHLTALIAAVITAGGAVAMQPALSGSGAHAGRAHDTRTRIVPRAAAGDASGASAVVAYAPTSQPGVAAGAGDGAAQAAPPGGLVSSGAPATPASSVTRAPGANAAPTLSVGLLATQTLSGVVPATDGMTTTTGTPHTTGTGTTRTTGTTLTPGASAVPGRGIGSASHGSAGAHGTSTRYAKPTKKGANGTSARRRVARSSASGVLSATATLSGGGLDTSDGPVPWSANGTTPSDGSPSDGLSSTGTAVPTAPAVGDAAAPSQAGADAPTSTPPASDDPASGETVAGSATASNAVTPASASIPVAGASAQAAGAAAPAGTGTGSGVSGAGAASEIPASASTAA